MIDCHLAAAANLDPRKRPGYKLEVIGFDFLIDEDLRVWLIEVNTCPFLGPVLPAEQPNFMLDLIDDTLKITLDKLFFDRQMTPEEMETETRYELLCNCDGSFSKRSLAGLEDVAKPEASPKVDSNSATPKREAKKLADNIATYFSAGLYPSKQIHERVMASQLQHHERWVKHKAEEAMLQQRALRARAAKQ